jgi:hypothetical protein
MKRLTVAVAAVFVLSGSTAATTQPPHQRESTNRIDACLRRHGWPYGYTALLGAEIRHGHPNGLVRICGVDARGVATSTRPQPTSPAAAGRHR